MSTTRKNNGSYNNDIQIAVITEKLDTIKKDVSDIKSKLARSYVTKDQHALAIDRLTRLEKIVYGVVGLILIAFMGAIISFFIPGVSF